MSLALFQCVRLVGAWRVRGRFARGCLAAIAIWLAASEMEWRRGPVKLMWSAEGEQMRAPPPRKVQFILPKGVPRAGRLLRNMTGGGRQNGRTMAPREREYQGTTRVQSGGRARLGFCVRRTLSLTSAERVPKLKSALRARMVARIFSRPRRAGLESLASRLARRGRD